MYSSKLNRGARAHGQGEGERLDTKFLAGEFVRSVVLTGTDERY